MFEKPIAGTACPPSYDALTLALTRPAFLGELTEQALLAQRSGSGFCLLLLDLDHLQNINDCHGVAAGDDVLVGLTDRCRRVDRRAGLASFRIHVRSLRWRRADDPRAPLCLESGRDACRGAAFRSRGKALERPHQRDRLDRRRAISHRRVRRRAVGSHRARAARREAVRPRPRRGGKRTAEPQSSAPRSSASTASRSRLQSRRTKFAYLAPSCDGNCAFQRRKGA